MLRILLALRVPLNYLLIELFHNLASSCNILGAEGMVTVPEQLSLSSLQSVLPPKVRRLCLLLNSAHRSWCLLYQRKTQAYAGTSTRKVIEAFALVTILAPKIV